MCKNNNGCVIINVYVYFSRFSFQWATTKVLGKGQLYEINIVKFNENRCSFKGKCITNNLK